jgi:hypothetical protein
VRVLGRPCAVSECTRWWQALRTQESSSLVDLVQADDLVAGLVAARGDLRQELPAPGRPCLRFWPPGGQAAELAASQARRASSAP